MSYSPLKRIKICFRRGIILLNNEKLTTSYREAESMAESQSGTLAGHELISRTIRKCCTFVFLRTLLLLCSWKIWSGQEKRASNFWAVYCMSWTAVYGAVSIFAYGGRRTRLLCWGWELSDSPDKQSVCVWSWKRLGCECRMSVQAFGAQNGRRYLGLLEGQHRKTCAVTVSSCGMGR